MSVNTIVMMGGRVMVVMGGHVIVMMIGMMLRSSKCLAGCYLAKL